MTKNPMLGFLYSERSLQETFRHKYVQVNQVKMLAQQASEGFLAPDQMLSVISYTYGHVLNRNG